MAITREQKIEQSVQDYVSDRLFNVENYPQDKIEILDSFPYNRFTGSIDKTYVAFGFNFDDQGKAAEMGSDLKTRVYTLELFVFGQTDLWGKNVAHAMKFGIDTDEIVPLKDIGEPGQPVIDSLVIVGCQATKVVVPDPEPYQEAIYLVTVRVEDTYFASLAV